MNGQADSIGLVAGSSVRHRTPIRQLTRRLAAAEALGVRVIEADLHLFRGRIEVRHLKTIGPVPLLWDRWKLANPFAPRLLLADLLCAAGPQTELVLDLKGRDCRLAEIALEAVRPHLRAGAVMTICARSGPLLEPFTASKASAGCNRSGAHGSSGGCGVAPRVRASTAFDSRAAVDSSTVRELRELRGSDHDLAGQHA